MNAAQVRVAYGDDAPTIMAALDVLAKRIKVGRTIESPEDARHFLQLTHAHLDHEEFRVLYLDVNRRIIADQIETRGTLEQSAVYPREIVKEAMRHNAASVILCHNHPGGGQPEPSGPDIQATGMIMMALRYVGVEVLDHVIVATGGTYSMEEAGDLTGIEMQIAYMLHAAAHDAAFKRASELHPRMRRPHHVG